MDVVAQRQLAAVAVATLQAAKWLHWLALTTTGSSGEGAAFFWWMVGWSVVDVAWVVALTGAAIPRLRVSPGRAAVLIALLCLANERASGSLVRHRDERVRLAVC
jgi:hypothetical protein